MTNKRHRLVLSAVALGTLGISSIAAAEDPILAVGHGALVGRDGKSIRPTPEFLKQAQLYYRTRLVKEASPETRAELLKLERRVKAAQLELGFDEVVGRSFLLHWLIEKVQPRDALHLIAKNATIRSNHLAAINEKLDRAPPENEWGLDLDIVDFALSENLLFTTTNNNGAAYIAECRTAGVPIPPTFGGSGWVFEGNMPNSELFLSSQDSTEVWSHEPRSPNGICVALPRITGNTIGLLGVICLNRTNGNVCFWDKTNTPVGSQIPLSSFIGGTSLGPTGICSDCHAGENPYIVHPGTVIDLGARMQSSVFHNPIVKAGWPQPVPNTLLSLIPLGAADESCQTCHLAAPNAGRFPEVSVELDDYCDFILPSAMSRTMPLGSPGNPAYSKHMDALRAFCKQRPPDGHDVPGGGWNDDPKHVSPPIVLGPLYNCAEAIEVGGVVLHADLSVFIDGVLEATVTVTNPDQQVVSVTPLVAGQVVTATQKVDGVDSASSNPETVHDHLVDFPAGLPAPEIDPIIHECGRMISVHHLQGARVTVYVNGADPSSYGTSGDYTDLPPLIRPFNLGDEYTAEYQVCNDLSPLSQPETAVVPPSPYPTPAFDPPTVFEGQELALLENLAHGADSRVFVQGFGQVAHFSTGVSWKPNINVAASFGGPLSVGNVLQADSSLCVAGRRISTAPAQPCTNMPAPKIQQPFVGNTQVVVTQMIPGARIMVFDANNVELADSSGTVIQLNRALVVGDVLTVRQKLGPCFSAMAYQVSVLCSDPNQGC